MYQSMRTQRQERQNHFSNERFNNANNTNRLKSQDTNTAAQQTYTSAQNLAATSDGQAHGQEKQGADGG